MVKVSWFVILIIGMIVFFLEEEVIEIFKNCDNVYD